MSTRILIVLVVIVVLLAVLAVVLGANRKGRESEEKDVKGGRTGMAPFLDRAFGWMAPRFDLADLSVQGATIDREKRTLVLNADQKFTLTVKAKPDADVNSCRSLKLVLTTPKATIGGPAALMLTDITLRPPLPDPDEFEPPDTGQLLPNNRLEPDPITNKIDPERVDECAIPVFRGGATIVLEAKRACTVEVR
jgi:hypothetical protein